MLVRKEGLRKGILEEDVLPACGVVDDLLALREQDHGDFLGIQAVLLRYVVYLDRPRGLEKQRDYRREG